MHSDSEGERLKLSPATLSRFTTICARSYSPTELQDVLQQRLQALLCSPGGGGKERGVPLSEVQALLTTLMSLKQHTEAEVVGAHLTLRQLLQCISFVAGHTSEPLLLQRLLVGFRWLVLDSLGLEAPRQQQLAATWLERQQQQQQQGGAGLEQLQHAVAAAFVLPDQDPTLLQPEHLLRLLPSGHVRLEYTGVAAKLAVCGAAEQQQPWAPVQRMRLSCTPSLVLSMARIMAAATVQGLLLLEGPPGIGKTAVCEQMATLLGYGCERINVSANTTLDQLLGSYMPKMVAGSRMFVWQDGVLVAAIKAGKWLLLDEINLAPPEVLAAIAPLFDR